jgi:hypothetical protein
MNFFRQSSKLILVIIAASLLAACGTDEATLVFDEDAISTSVAGTQIAAAAETEAAGDLKESDTTVEAVAEVFPKIEPFPFGEMQAIVLTGIPPMLPAEFPVEEGQPPIVADLLTLGDLYEIALEFSPDCHGAGACHYGTAYGKKAASTVPVGTSTFQFDIDEAQIVELARGITGYFTPGECGASCDDGRVRWVYDGFEYMIGIKGGQLDDVVALANAAILNSIP